MKLQHTVAIMKGDATTSFVQPGFLKSIVKSRTSPAAEAV